MKATYKIAHAAGQDAGNRNKKEHDRAKWNEDDWNIAADAFHKIMGTN